MTVAATEVAAADAAPAAVAAGPRRARRSPGRGGASTPRPRPATPTRQPLPPPEPRGQGSGQSRSRARSRKGTQIPGFKFPTGTASRTNYQPIILAEFVAAVLLTAATPFASKKNPQGLSPYAGSDMIKIAALTVLYLVLALISTGGRGAGRFSAWFGGLILLVVGMGEAANLAKDLDLFGIGGSPPADTGTPTSEPATPGGPGTTVT